MSDSTFQGARPCNAQWGYCGECETCVAAYRTLFRLDEDCCTCTGRYTCSSCRDEERAAQAEDDAADRAQEREIERLERQLERSYDGPEPE